MNCGAMAERKRNKGDLRISYSKLRLYCGWLLYVLGWTSGLMIVVLLILNFFGQIQDNSFVKFVFCALALVGIVFFRLSRYFIKG